MSRGLNKVMLIGNVGNKNDLIQSKNGVSVLNFTLATNIITRDKETGKHKEIPEWHSITMYDKMADIAEKFIKKGSKVYVEGYLKTESFKNKNGQDVKSTKIVGMTLNLLDKLDKNEYSPAPNGSEYTNKYAEDQYKDHQIKKQNGYMEDQFDDEIPF